MKIRRRLFALFVSAGLLLPEAPSAADSRQIALAVGQLLEQGHYSGWQLGPQMSERILHTYLEDLDNNKLFLTQGDVSRLRAKYGKTLGRDIPRANLGPATAIYGVFRARVQERVAKIRQLLKDNYDFKSNRSVDLNRQNKPWPADAAAADLLWRDRIEGELLQVKLDGLGAREPGSEVLARRYEQMLKTVADRGEDDIEEIFLNAAAESYDPHSEYMGRSNLEGFETSMRLSLVGIGAEVSAENGYAKVRRLMPGGPAAKCAQVRVGDRIIAVAQGNGPFVDTREMKLDDVIELIRGKKGTVLRLQLLPPGATDPSKWRVVELVRDTVKLTDEEANAEIIEKPLPDGTSRRLGWITLPSFYEDPGKLGLGKSASRDVAALIKRLNQEKIQGLVVDLRSNGGGSLDEAVNMSGLFINQGPVAQVKYSDGGTEILRDKEGKAHYTGPLILLVNKLSASASELFAAAMQDYGRALIVGDSSTFGKGTVQVLIELRQVVPRPSAEGALKLTVQKFYRVAGGSTQLKGVLSDVRLPSVTDNAEFGERSLHFPLACDGIAPAPIGVASNHRVLLIDQLRQRSAARVNRDSEFQNITEDSQEINERLKINRVSLNEAVRRSEMVKDAKRKEKEAAENKHALKADRSLTYRLTLADIKRAQLPLVGKESEADNPAFEDDDDENEGNLVESETASPEGRGAVKRETLNILADLIDFSKSPPPLYRTDHEIGAGSQPGR
jgi:carboxyl-terminal processing protease